MRPLLMLSINSIQGDTHILIENGKPDALPSCIIITMPVIPSKKRCTMPELEMALKALGFSRGELKGQTAVITGAGRGIGFSTAQAFAWLGANVVIAEISAPGEAVENLKAQHPDQVLFVNTDISNEESVTRLYTETRRAFGSTDFLFNNVIHCPVALVLETDIRSPHGKARL
jgi:hypothetical protein